jgi:tetratricopeptide (TPR) repeat protein
VALSLRKKNRADVIMQCAALFGLVWAFVTILPASSFVPLLDVAVEHRTYLPMVGFAFFASAMICQSAKINYKTAPVFATLVLVLFSALLIDRNRVWKNEITLWTDAQKKSPRIIRTYNNLGQAYDELGDYDHAIPQFEAAVKLNPNYFHALSNLGNIYGKKKDLPRAIDYFKKALKVKPDYAPANYNLAKALHLTGNPQEAITYYRTAVRVNPDFEEALFNLANLSLELRQMEEAIIHFEKFLRMQANHPMAHFQLANAYAITGRFDEAIREYQTTAELKPDHIMAYVNIANIMMQTGKIDNAIRVYEAALTVKPVPGIHKNLGMIYQQQKHDAKKAVEHYEAYLRLQPNAPDSAIVRSVIESLKNS